MKRLSLDFKVYVVDEASNWGMEEYKYIDIVNTTD